MELLCLKSGDRYLKITEDGYLLTTMSRASVFLLKESAVVKQHFNKHVISLNNLLIVKLTISEEIADI